MKVRDKLLFIFLKMSRTSFQKRVYSRVYLISNVVIWSYDLDYVTHTNCSVFFRVNYRLTSRTKPKSSQGTSLMPNGAPLSMINGYTQTLIQHYPKYSQKYCSWLTNGLKVQSVRSRPGSYDFSQSRPPPPLLQYINRPKSVNGRYGVRKSHAGVNFNVVGVQHRS